MGTDRKLRLWRLLSERGGSAAVDVSDVCAAAMTVVGVDGAGITLTLGTTPREPIHATGPLAAELEELAVTLGEGPTVDASAGTVILVGDVMTPEPLARWPAFAPAAASAGVRAVFALPLRIGAIRLGVLDLYRAVPGELDSEQLADALALADTACGLLLDAQERSVGHPDGGQPELARPQHPEVHQATGMLTVQLGVTAAVALIRLRAYAYSHERRLRDVARDVVARRLRFDFGGSSDDDPAST
jgi:hypothetical protein